MSSFPQKTPPEERVLRGYGEALSAERLSDDARARIAARLCAEASADGKHTAGTTRSEQQAKAELKEKAVARTAGARTAGSRKTGTRKMRARAAGALGAAACLAIALLLGAGAMGALPGGAGSSSDEGAAHSFALASYAYAAARADAEDVVPAGLALDAFRPARASQAEFDPLSGKEPADGGFLICALFDFDATCEGAGLASVDYEVVGDDVFFEFYDEDKFLAAHGEAPLGEDENDATPSYEVSVARRFTARYEDGVPASGRVRCQVGVTVPMTEHVEALLDAYRAAAADDPGEAVAAAAALEAAGFAIAAEHLADVTFRMTATFSDGTSLVRAYRLIPLPGFQERCLAYLQDAYGQPSAAADDPGAAPGEAPSDRPAALFRIEEVSPTA